MLINRWPAWWLVVAAASMLVARPRLERAAMGRVGLAAGAAILGCGAVWNANILAGRIVRDRLADQWLRSADVFVYQWMHLAGQGYDHVFPHAPAGPTVTEMRRRSIHRDAIEHAGAP